MALLDEMGRALLAEGGDIVLDEYIYFPPCSVIVHPDLNTGGFELRVAPSLIQGTDQGTDDGGYENEVASTEVQT